MWLDYGRRNSELFSQPVFADALLHDPNNAPNVPNVHN